MRDAASRATGRGRTPIATYVIGIGLSSEADAAEVDSLVAEVLADHEITAREVELVATLETKTDHPALADLRWRVTGLPADLLAEVTTPSPSARTARAVGTTSVAEAAALLGAGLDAELVVTKRRSAHATVAVARTVPRRKRRSLLMP